MKSIIKELYYGNLREYDKEIKCKNLSNKETEIYNKLIESLSLEQNNFLMNNKNTRNYSTKFAAENISMASKQNFW